MAKKPLSFRFIVIATLLGNTLEWYDFVCFGFLVPIFKEIFFPNTTYWVSLLYTMLGFVFGSILRPIGGFLFGFIGDRYGRRLALLASVLLISIPTLFYGFLPTYLQIGIIAPILMFLLRLFQGLAVGGELPGAFTFLVESSTVNNSGFYGSFAMFGVFLGSLLGLIDLSFIDKHLINDDFLSWGWRLMFIFGGVLGGITYFLRRKLHETPVFNNLRESHAILKDPLLPLFKNHKKAILKAMCIYMLSTLCFNLFIAFSVTYYVFIKNFSLMKAIQLNSIFLVVLVALVPLAGLISDRFGHKRIATLAAAGLFIFSVPLYMALDLPEPLALLNPIGQAILLAFYTAPMAANICRLFPSNMRYSGVAAGLNLAVALVGGFSPLLTLGFILYTGIAIAPSFFVMVFSLIALAALFSLKRDQQDHG